MGTTDQITECELHDALANLDFFAVRAKGILALADKIRVLRSLLTDERGLRERVADLQGKAEDAKAVVAQGDAAQHRLENLNAELDAHRRTMDAERAKVLEEARAEGASIIAAARDDAGTLLAQARAQAAQEAVRQDGELRERQENVSALDSEIATRRDELNQINQAIAEARAKIGAR